MTTLKLGIDIHRSVLVLSPHAYFTHAVVCLDCDRDIALVSSDAEARAVARAHNCAPTRKG